MVVDLAVEHNDEAFATRMHGLAAALREIQDRKPSEAKSDSSLRIRPGRFVVRAPVSHGFSHSRHQGRKLLVVPFARRVNEASKTAHSVLNQTFARQKKCKCSFEVAFKLPRRFS